MVSVYKTGRGKNPRIEGENFVAELGKFKLRMDKEEENLFERMKKGEEIPVHLNDDRPFVKADIYRCLCKYIISLVSESELPLFTDTISWIMKRRKSGVLPLIYRNEKDFDLTETPVLEIYSPVNNTDRYKGWIGVFRFLTNLWIFAVPYVKGCRNDKLATILNRFVSNYFPNINFVREEFGSENNSYVTTHFTIGMGQTSRLTSFADMTDDERREFMASMPKRWS